MSINFSSFSLGMSRLVFGGDMIMYSGKPDPFFRLILQSLSMCEKSLLPSLLRGARSQENYFKENVFLLSVN